MDLRKLFGGGRNSRDKAIAADLGEAARWLHAGNLANGCAWGLGEERRFEVDQEAGRMTLFFRDGKQAELPIQIIASFLPAERNVRWAWANESVAPTLAAAASELKRYGETRAVAALTRAGQALSFEDLVKYAALAASRFGCTGLYRCLREDYSTVFVGFGPPELQSKDGAPLPANKWWPRARAGEESQAAARSLVEAWDAEMFPVDRDFHRLKARTDDELDSAIEAKHSIYRRYWSPKKDSWRPGDLTWPSDHDPAAFLPTLTVPRRSGGCFVVRWPSPYRNLAYVVESLDGEFRITDIDSDWGNGLVWIAATD
jgi:hypothetical protein